MDTLALISLFLELLREYDSSAAAYVDRGEARITPFHDKYFHVVFIDGTRWEYIVREDGVHSLD